MKTANLFNIVTLSLILAFGSIGCSRNETSGIPSQQIIQGDPTGGGDSGSDGTPISLLPTILISNNNVTNHRVSSPYLSNSFDLAVDSNLRVRVGARRVVCNAGSTLVPGTSVRLCLDDPEDPDDETGMWGIAHYENISYTVTVHYTNGFTNERETISLNTGMINSFGGSEIVDFSPHLRPGMSDFEFEVQALSEDSNCIWQNPCSPRNAQIGPNNGYNFYLEIEWDESYSL